jgi:hypothetical protein
LKRKVPVKSKSFTSDALLSQASGLKPDWLKVWRAVKILDPDWLALVHFVA